MLVPAYSAKGCIHSVVTDIGDTDCCCNCIHRHMLIVGGLPIKFMCVNDFGEGPGHEHVAEISYTGHGMCECHERYKKIQGINII